MSFTSVIIYNSAKNFFSSKSKNYDKINEFKIKIGIIKKVCSFDVNSTIRIHKITNNKWTYFFDISSKKIKINNNEFFKFLIYEKTFEKLTLNNIQLFLKFISEIMEKVNFNKLTGIFESLNIEQSHLKNSFVTKECCVCYDKTMTQTSCKHFLCLECWSKLKKISECPYCRCENITNSLFI